MPSWTPEQILALAPDSASAKSGSDLSAPRKWQTLGRSERAAWGLCQGSGKTPYQTQIDLGEPAFRCSCPSRKFPCKHGLGLFLALSAQPAAFSETSAPDWVTAWLDSRSQRQEQRAERAEAKAKVDGTGIDREAQAKRIAERERKVAAGLDELERWLEDIIRRGLAEVQTQPASFWDGIASRMVDAQAPGLARLVREASGIAAGGDGWPARLLDRLGRMHLLIEGYRRLDTLPEGTQADIRARVGWNLREEDLVQSEATVDRWLILGQRTETEDRLRVQRTWMVGEDSGRAALLLQFAHGSAPMDASLVPGSALRAGLVFYPGAAPLRAALKERLAPPEPLDRFPGHATLLCAARAYSEALARDPWVERYPVALAAVVPVRQGEAWSTRDADGHAVPLRLPSDMGWTLLGISGGEPLGLFGEWDGEQLYPVSAWSAERLYRLDRSGDGS